MIALSVMCSIRARFIPAAPCIVASASRIAVEESCPVGVQPSYCHSIPPVSGIAPAVVFGSIAIVGVLTFAGVL